ncbi:MAG TPA: hypothetical protein VIK78_06075 [Ruminiclostridium sp.]
MLKKKAFYVFTMLVGICLIGVSLFLRSEELKSISGVFIGVGAGLFGTSIANLFMKNFEKKNPGIMKQNEIDFKDERNVIIRNRAKAKAADITQWLIMDVAYITILINAALWVTLVTVCVYLIYKVLGIYFMNKFQKEM